jgi:hypothetical protein
MDLESYVRDMVEVSEARHGHKSTDQKTLKLSII